ncbi:hypothetical protein TNCV_2647601 [Trichonephila clavipes]|nr:hypothetical protein TNCV_2647601 [Trichonephila clavipes]
MVHFEFLPRSQTINTDVYRRQLEECHRKLRIKQSSLVNRSDSIFLHDAAGPYVSVASQGSKYVFLTQSPYSPNLAPTDYCMFCQLDGVVSHKQSPNQDALIQGGGGSSFFHQCYRLVALFRSKLVG